MNLRNILFLLQKIIIYIIFIIGISIISEYIMKFINTKKIDNYSNKLSFNTKKIDNYSNNFNSNYNNMNLFPYRSNPIESREDLIIKEVSRKLEQGVPGELDKHSLGSKTLGQIYNKIDKDNENVVTYENLYKKFEELPRQINWQEPEKIIIPPKKKYMIDYNYNYYPSKYNLLSEYNGKYKGYDDMSNKLYNVQGTFTT